MAVCAMSGRRATIDYRSSVNEQRNGLAVISLWRRPAACTNEGNSDLSADVPKLHIASIRIEKIIPRLEHLAVFVRLLPPPSRPVGKGGRVSAASISAFSAAEIVKYCATRAGLDSARPLGAFVTCGLPHQRRRARRVGGARCRFHEMHRENHWVVSSAATDAPTHVT